MATLIQTNVTENRGTPRVWAEGESLARAGISPGTILEVTTHHGRMILAPAKNQERVKGRTVTVSKRTKKGRVTPLIEVRLPAIVSLFGLGARVVIKALKGRLSIARHHQDNRIARREARLMEKLEKGEPLETASLYHGGGVMAHAIHEGFKRSDVASVISLAAEIEPAYLSSSLQNNPHLFSKNAILLNAPMEQLAFSVSSVEVDGVEGGVPCVGASKFGKVSNGIEHAEEHDSAGVQFYAFLRMIEVTNPAFCILENVCEYRRTASYAIIKATLKMLGYRLADRDLNGNEFGALEGRNRMVMIAVSEGLDIDLDLEAIESVRIKETSLEDVLDAPDVAAQEAEFRDYAHLRKKEERDRKAGKDFRRNLLTPDAAKVPTLVRHYAKAGSTSAQLKHPSDPLLTRLFTVAEHARIKTIPASLVAGLSKTVAHEVMGQSVIHAAFVATAKWLGAAFKAALLPCAQPHLHEAVAA